MRPPDNCAARIKLVRHLLHLTQTEMAERIGVSFVTVCRWENGHSKPLPLAWKQFCDLEARYIRSK